tara:strand:+ start:993 stop:3872 length:2880 start_codon:yes stop_codon:yes gene_type:complete
MTNPSTGYSQTFLFDCSRLGSEEFNGSTLAVSDASRFTNKVSSGIKLDIGDQVSVHSAYISESGAGGDVIEFKGKSLNTQYEINYTTTTDTVYIDGTQITPTGFGRQQNVNASHFVQLKDNEASIVLSYYKNTNGENYNGLPRDWGDYIRSASSSSAVGGSQLIWNEKDGNSMGAQPLSRNASHYFPDDIFLKDINLNGDSNSSGVVTNGDRPFIRNDNSRFTIYCLDDIYWSKEGGPSASDIEEYTSWVSVHDPSPALRNYNKFKSRVDLTINKGYNAPSNVAADFTDTLNAINERYVPFDVSSFVQESTTLKPFPATNFSLFSRENASSYFGASAHKGSNEPNASLLSYRTLDYLSSYAYVGFKRPEFVDRGRELNNFDGFTIENNPLTTEDVLTNIPWDNDNLTKLRNLFSVEHDLYPELIKREVTRGVNDTYNASYSAFGSNASDAFLFQARFLHMDSSSYGAVHPLGNDNMNSSYAGALNFDYSSMPLFVYFNNSCSNIIYDESDLSTIRNVGDQNSNLVYGFARKYTSGGIDYVSFVTEPLGGITNWHGNATMKGRRIGYDYHFNAYGNAAIQLTNGYAPCSFYGQETFGSGSHLSSGSDTAVNRYQNSVRQVYVGANSPLLNFDNVESRFAFSNLHSPEQVGNFWNAGRTQGSDTQISPPVSGQEGDVYHINKTLQYNTWSPHMLPYPPIDVSGRTGSTTGGASYSTGFIPLSSNLEDGVIYDSHSGVVIEDFGFDQVNWKEGLWGILGFSYEQFQGTDNLQTRFTNLTTNVRGATTNALITSEDTRELMTNVWGTKLFNQQVPSIMRYNYTGIWALNTYISNASDGIHPSITVNQNSTEIKAQNLPRKQLRGYFLLKSDILSDANYFKEADPMSVFAVVDKYNSEGDFINYQGNGPIFTVTQPKQLTEICTSILDPDGSPALVSDYSAVIYRVDKSISTNLLVSQEVLNQK